MKRLKIKYVHNIYGNYWLVRNKKKDILGTFSYDKNWERMVWSQNKKMQMSNCCLQELVYAMERRLKRLVKLQKESKENKVGNP